MDPRHLRTRHYGGGLLMLLFLGALAPHAPGVAQPAENSIAVLSPPGFLEPSPATPADQDGYPPTGGAADPEEGTVAVRLTVVSPIANPTVTLRRTSDADAIVDLAIDEGDGNVAVRDLDYLDGVIDSSLAPGTYTIYFNVEKSGYRKALPLSSGGESVRGDTDTFTATLRGANIPELTSAAMPVIMEASASIDQNDIRWLETAPSAITAMPGESFTVRVKYEHLRAGTLAQMLLQSYYEGSTLRLDNVDLYYYDANGVDPGPIADAVPAGWAHKYANQILLASAEQPLTLGAGDRWIAEFTFTVVGPGSSRFVPYVQTRSKPAVAWRVDSGYRNFAAQVPGGINAAVLAVDKSFGIPKVVSGPDPLVEGETTTFQLRITASNTGLDDAADVIVSDAIPAGVTFVSLLPASQGEATYDATTRTIAWDVGTLARDPDGPGAESGGSATLDFQVSVTPDAGEIGAGITLNAGAVATATSKGCDLPLRAASKAVSTAGAAAMTHELRINTTVDKAVAAAGDQLTYTITYSNAGNQAETGVVVTDTLPANTAFVKASDNGTYDPGTRTVTWNVGNRPVASNSYTLSFTVALGAFPSGTTLVSNVAQIRSSAVAAVASAPASTSVSGSAQTTTLTKSLAVGAAAPLAGTSLTFAAGSLIIPMDTDTSANHASYNQNLGMWKAYGLVYRLLQNGIPVNWAITQDKTYNAIDFTATNVTDKRTGTSLGSWSYRGGPFIISNTYAAQAMPIIQTWWAAKGNQPNVHEAVSGFDANVDIVLRSAPRIANESINSGISIAYYNAAGIPDLNGNAWSSTSPNILDETEIAAGALFKQGVCTSRQFDIFVTPHNSGYSYSLTDPNNLGTKTYAQLDTFVSQGGGWTALCHSILSNENYIRDLTVNGSTAVKNLFMTSKPGGVPGGFLTTNGFSTISNSTGGGTWTINAPAADLPVAQAVSTTVAQALPGGSVQTWPATGTGAPTYYAHTERVGYFDATVDQDNIIAGTYHDGTGLGKLTYIGGHSFSTAVPYSGNYEAPYLRAFYNSLFFNGAAVAKLDLTYSPTTFPQGGTQPLYVNIENAGASTATNVGNVKIVLNTGFTYVATISGPAPTVSGQQLTWSSLGDIAGGTTAVTIQLAVDTSISSGAGLKQFGTFHATYGDIYAEGFTADMCRALEVSPVPGLSLTKTPATQGPVSAGASVSWTLTYRNTGAAALNNVVLQDTLPTRFTYSSSSSSIGSPLVIPGSPTIVRWTMPTLAAGASGTVTITALAGAATPPSQTFTNNAKLTGKDAGGTAYSTAASAQVTVETVPITVGKTVDQTFISSLPGVVTYTIRPKYEGQGLLTDVKVIDPLPTGVTFQSAGQGGSYGAYAPTAAIQGVENDGTAPDSTVSLSASPTAVAAGGTTTVTMTVTSTAAVTAVTPDPLAASDGSVCSAPSPASQNIGAGGTITFAYTCTMANLGEVTFSAGASGTYGVDPYDFSSAASNSVLVSANGATNVVTWPLGSNTTAIDNSVVTGGAGDGIYAFRGSNSTTFWRYDLGTSAWSAVAPYGGAVEEGGALAYDGGGYAAGYIYGMRGNGTTTFQRYDIDLNSWIGRANTPQNVGDGGALVYLGGYVYAVRGAGKPDFWRYDPGANSWAAMTAVPVNVNKGGSLTTDGTNLYLLTGNGSKLFYRYNVAANTWTRLADIGANVARGGALARIGNYIYATVGNGSNKFYRYDIPAGTWSAMAVVPGAVKDGGALTTDGTYVYALQGNNTKNFYRYTPSTNTWATLTLTPDVVKSNGGGALAFVPGNATTIRKTSVDAMNRLVVGGDSITVTATFTSTDAVSSVTPTIAITGSGGASATCGSPVPATINLAAGVPGTITYTCTATAGTTAGGSVVFKVSATGGGGATFAQATSNSVLVTPPLTFQATVPVGGPSQIVNEAFLSASGQSVSSPPVTTNTGSSALTITKSNAPLPGTTLLPGDTIVYTMVVQNIGSGNATGVVVTDSVPTNTVYASCSGGTSCVQSGGIVTWNVGSLAPGDTATLTMSVSAAAALAISGSPYVVANSASAASTEVPTPVVSNQVTNQIQVLPAITKSVTPEQTALGGTLTYTLVVSNPGTTFTATVSDPVPTGTSLVAGSCSPGCTVVGDAVTWAGVSIPPGTTAFTFAVTVTASGGSFVSNAATLDPSTPDLAPIGSNQIDTPVGPDLGLVKFNSPDGEVSSGSTITYTLLLSNQSLVAATGTVVTDTIPAGTSYGSCTTTTGTCSQSGGVLTWTVGTLPADADATLTFTVTVGTIPPGTLQINNTAQATAVNAPSLVPSNMVSNPVAGTTTLALLLNKSASPTTYNATGQTITYSYVLTNIGTATLHGFAVSDDKLTVTCPATPTTLGPDETITCTATHVITQADLDAGSIVNIATATAKDPSEATVTSNASSATVTSTKTPIDAVNDSAGPVVGTVAHPGIIPNVLSNDTLNGVPVNAAAVVLTTTVADPSGKLTLNPNGSVDLAAGAPAGSYTLTYKICQVVNTSNCDTATVTVTVAGAPIDAVNDAGTANGYTGGAAVTNVLANDTLNGVAVVPSTVTTTQVSTTNPGVTLSGTNVVVAAGTPAGTYTVVYQICEVLNPTNCDTANVVVTVGAAPIDAVNDAGTANGLTGGTAVANVLANDTLNGAAVVPGNVTTTQISTTNANVTLSGTGVVVAPGTPAGTYTVVYQICEVLNPTNCDTADVVVTVGASPIDAIDDAGSVNGSIGGTAVASVLTNDTLNGTAIVAGQVTTSFVSSTNTNVTLVGNSVVVAPATAAGVYTLVYQICEVLNPANCDTANVKVTVGAAPIDAVNDTGTEVIGTSGGTSFTNVLANDTLNGMAITPGTVTISQMSTTNPGVTLDGPNVVVAAGTPAGNYELTYQICEVLNPANCDTAVVTVPVGLAPIVANDDAGTARGSTGGTAVTNVLTNDTLNGVPVMPAQVTATQVSTTDPKVTLVGLDVMVAPGTPAGTYTVTYEICETVNPANCDTADVVVTVSAAPIDAVNDPGTAVIGSAGGTSFTDVLGNDTLNGSAVVPGDVTLTFVSSTHSGVTLSGSDVMVLAGTPAGDYTLTYKICEVLNPTNCDQAVVTVPVTAAPIDAVSDAGTVNGSTGGTAVTNVLVNDTLNGVPIEPGQVTVTQVSTSNPNVTLDGTNVVVAAGTPAGTYTLVYQACEVLNPVNCDTAEVIVTVGAGLIDAVNDAGSPINGGTGGTTLANVLGNDTLNGAAVDPAHVTVTMVTSTNAGVTLDGNSVVVAPGTPAGDYTLTYQLCEALNPTNCDTAIVTVPVTAPTIDAIDDAGSANGGTGGTAVTNVLANDTLNGVAVVPGQVTVTQVSTTNPRVTLSGTNVVVAAGTPAGTYTLVYQICEVVNPANCDTANVTVTVGVSAIDAVNDSGAAVNGYAGGTSFTNVLANDTLNGVPVVPADVTLTPVSSTNAGVTLVGTNVVVAAGTPAGSYQLVYRICEILNPTNCDTATVTVPVSAPPIVANDDTGTANGTAGGTAVANVLANDTLNGVAVVPGQVTLTQVSTTNPGVTLSGNSVVVAPGTPAGTYTLVYQMCEVLNPTNCDTANVVVTVTTGGLLGVTPGAPMTTFGNPGTTTYDPTTHLFSMTATPLYETFGGTLGTKLITTPRGVSINIQVDNTGALIGGVAGNDLVLTGTIPGTSYSGVLLTGEIVAFGSQNVSTTDSYDFRFQVTGGALAPLFAGKDIGIRLTSENSTFTGSFATSFKGLAKGTIGPIAPLAGMTVASAEVFPIQTINDAIEDEPGIVRMVASAHNARL